MSSSSSSLEFRYFFKFTNILGTVGKAIGMGVGKLQSPSSERIIININLGNKIDITPSKNHSTVIKKGSTTHFPNSRIDILDDITREIRTRRYYDSEGKVYRDVDMDNHGNSKAHPEYSHEHFWKYDKNGNIIGR